MTISVASMADLFYAVRPHAVAPRSRDDRLVQEIRDRAGQLCRCSEDELRRQVSALKRQAPSFDATFDQAAVTSCFALLTEALRRTHGIELYDVQLVAGLALTRRSIAQMQTGEGKTLAASLATSAFALSGGGVHVMTVNTYLAERDYEMLSPVFELLGMSVGMLGQDASPAQKRDAYACDITYGPGYEFGFDYLRDQLALMNQPKQRLGDSHRRRLQGRGVTAPAAVQRGQAFAIVDEADSIMMDEATTPLILSGASSGENANPELYRHAMRLADQMQLDQDYVLDARRQIFEVTASGTDRIRQAVRPRADVGSQRPWSHYIDQALRAKLFLKRDVDYVIDEDVLMLVDEKTGRIFPDRSWRDGLRQAVEAREGIPITAENGSMARISRQRYLRLYDGICGLTGTAVGVEREYWQVYRMPVVEIPLRTPSQRQVLPTRFFATGQAKWKAIAADIQRIHATRQPILVGTRTIQDSDLLSAMLTEIGVPSHLLNGRQDAEEAEVVAAAGQAGSVTVATNMAGRGTDIKLGHGVAQLGGLHVIGCEIHESARVDRQLMGRCARQGDPGSCQFFVSAEDRLLAEHSPAIARRMALLADASGIVDVDFAAEIASLQRRMERQMYAARRRLFAHDRWLEESVTSLARRTSR